MSGRMHLKQPRAWDRGSPGRRRPSGERGKIDHFQRRESESPDRSKRSRWESPLRHRVESPARMRRRDFESSPRGNRNDMIPSPKSRRSGLEDGMKPSFSEQRRSEEEYRLRTIFQDSYREAQGPAGLVFLCSSSTLRECFHFRVLGLPAAQREVVERVVPGTRLFLFNFDTKELFGVFEATSRGGLNLVPEAFLDSKAAFAAQVRFNIIRECPPLADDIARDVLRENFSQRGKFDCELSADQVLKIMQLFSYQDMRPGGPGQDREKHGLDSRNIPSGVSAGDPDGRRFSSGLQVSLLPEINAFPESQLLMSKSHAEGANPDPAVVLGQGMIERVDQLALKYLQNQPGFAGIRLEPVNASLLSSTWRSNPQSGFSNPSMDHHPSSMPIGGNFGALNLQPNGVAFPAVGGGLPNPRLPSSSVPDSLNRDRVEHSEGGNIMGHFMPGALGSERGLLPAPGMHHHLPLQPGMPLPSQSGFPLQPGMPNQPGMVLPFPAGAALPGAFPTAVGPVGVSRPEFGGPFVPFHHLQGPHGLPPSQLMNRAHNQAIPNLKGANKPKRIKQKKRAKRKKGFAGGDIEDKKDDTAAEALDDAPSD